MVRRPSPQLVALVLVPALSLALPAPARGAPQQERQMRAAFLDGRLPAPDSDRVLDEARDAQRRFERLRERRMPRAFGGGGTRCDEVVGRYCLWHEDGDWEPPPEHRDVLEGRSELLDRLRRAATALPGDEWIAGQRVRYLVEDGRPPEALAAARACRAEPAWCAALEAYALHAAGRYEEAGQRFDRALELLPPEEACRWRDLRLVLDGEGAGRYDDLSCEARRALEEDLWRLADPLWAVPGNDRRTEHFARQVLDRMQRKAASGYGTGWGYDLRELLVRYGWPAGWERARRAGPGAGDESIVAHDPPDTRRWLPEPRWAWDPLTATPEAWELDPREPRSHYAPPYLRHVRSLRPPEFQIAAFRREDGVALVAAWDSRPPPGDTLPPCDSATALLGLELPDGRRSEVRREGDAERLRLDAPAPPGATVVVGLERHCPGARAAVRTRYGRRLPEDGVGLSDLLVLEDADSLPATLEEAAGVARRGLRARPGERLGLYWEAAGPEGTEAKARVRVTLRREGKGFFRRVAEWVGLADERGAAVGLEWRERSAEAGGRTPRAVRLTLPESLDEGTYRVELEVAWSSGRTDVRSLELEVVE